ncbi:MAG: hypothetical protein ACE5QF_08990 [Thermoplasmata archaeon]
MKKGLYDEFSNVGLLLILVSLVVWAVQLLCCEVPGFFYLFTILIVSGLGLLFVGILTTTDKLEAESHMKSRLVTTGWGLLFVAFIVLVVPIMHVSVGAYEYDTAVYVIPAFLVLAILGVILLIMDWMTKD